MAWTNQALTLFHGTNTLSMAAYRAMSGPPFSLHMTLAGFTINLAACRPRTDLGQGFYTTTSLHQAREWANEGVRKFASSAPPVASAAMVLVFIVDRNDLAGLDTLGFVRPTKDYFDLVTYCRLGRRPHLRPSSLAPTYDVVFGPVALGFQQLVLHDCDQISFHTPNAVTLLSKNKPNVYELSNRPNGLLP